MVDDNLAFTKDRTVSRLIEMQSQEYLREHAERRAPELLLALEVPSCFRLRLVVAGTLACTTPTWIYSLFFSRIS